MTSAAFGAADIRVLGPMELRGSDGNLVVLPPKPATLLVVLLLNLDLGMSNDQLKEHLWDEEVREDDTLYGYIKDVRAALRTLDPRAQLLRSRGLLMLRLPNAEVLDVRRFTQRLKTAEGADTPEDGLAAVEAAIGEFRGEPWTALKVGKKLGAKRTGLVNQWIQACDRHARLLIELGLHDQAIAALDEYQARWFNEKRFDVLRAEAIASAAAQRKLSTPTRQSGTDTDRPTHSASLSVFNLDRIDFGGMAFHDEVVGKEEHPHGLTPTILDGLPGLAAVAPGFTGREDDLERLLAALDPNCATDGGGVVISALGGMAGVGKTALAVAAAHAVRKKGWYAAVLFMNLRGYDTDPVTAEQALPIFLRALGVDPVHFPPTLEEQASLYRSRLAKLAGEKGAPLLVIADNVSLASQVRPLLPGMGEHRLLITSRDRLHTLGAIQLDVAVLDPHAAVELLRSLLTRAAPADGRDSDAAGLECIARRCGCLPLALQICAALLVRSPHLSLARLAEKLTDSTNRLEHLNDGERAVRSAFDLSYARLAPKCAQVFLLLGIAPGHDIATAAVAVLTDMDTESVAEVLDELAAAYLISNDPESDRWGMHDLVADYARWRAVKAAQGDHKVAEAQRMAVVRVLDYYTRVAKAADRHLRETSGENMLDEFTGRNAALAWLDTEHATLLAAVRTARDINHNSTAIDLPLYLAECLDLRRYLDDQITVTMIARQVAQQIGNARDQALAWNILGNALRHSRRFDEAIEAHEHACTIHQKVGDRRGEAQALNNRGIALRHQRHFDEAVRIFRDALALFRKIKDRRGEAEALNNLGIALREQRHLGGAVKTLKQALVLFKEIGDRRNEAIASNSLGTALGLVGKFDEAIEAHEHACTIHQEVGDRRGEAMAWNSLGKVFLRMERFDEATGAHKRALVIHCEIGNGHGEAMAWNGLGIALSKIGRLAEAVAAFGSAIEIFARIDDERLRANAEKNLANTRAKWASDS
ncbi:AfsR/SARP family transcriptional regulator [Actinokineospora diospyrosa]|uniref:Transcriptional regulatory protein, C terminal n=1 Tax=Actinokineospora diospyrosa TaxID=103728 RepID=A0ABT1I9F8_9PSEU|nr:tetratricopeptide repeat protein [Actinokineospora diospyrosa]MCP2269273.1 Transcriptional regulatory protein, C terminal [Actinokineospora diospyrosa]